MDKPVRIKAGETFKAEIVLPETPCPCGVPWGKLSIESSPLDEDGLEDGRVRMSCPKCGKSGPWAEARWLAALAWAGMISREKASG